MAIVEHDLDRLLVDAFRRASWRVHSPRSGEALQPDLIVEGGGKQYVVEMKRSSEGRRDRLIPLLSEAILEAQAYARQFSEAAVPVAVVGAERVPPSVVDSIKAFAGRFAPSVAVGVIDAQGMRAFSGHGLEILNAAPPRAAHGRAQIAYQRLPNLFSDLNQWMLKVLLAQWIPDDLLSAPRVHFRNASELARAANVSVMSAFRFVHQLANGGFLEQSEGRLELVRIPELLSRWAAARQQAREFPVRWMIKRDRDAVPALLKSYAANNASIAGLAVERRRPSRVCLGLFAAADALGFGFVHGVPPYICMERYDLEALHLLGLSAEAAEHNPDAYIRIPASVESVFRAAVMRNGVPVADILQVWLDVSAHPSRGRAQADEIARRVLGALLGKK